MDKRLRLELGTADATKDGELMRRSKNHRNTTRLTARERAAEVVGWFKSTAPSGTSPAQAFEMAMGVVQRALQAHARQTLARERARRERAVN